MQIGRVKSKDAARTNLPPIPAIATFKKLSNLFRTTNLNFLSFMSIT